MTHKISPPLSIDFGKLSKLFREQWSDSIPLLKPISQPSEETMSTAVTPLGNMNPTPENPERQYERPMEIADAYLRSQLPNELRMRPDSQHAIHLSWTELTKLLSQYHGWALARIWRD